jgi:hypothetical protein
MVEFIEKDFGGIFPSGISDPNYEYLKYYMFQHIKEYFNTKNEGVVNINDRNFLGNTLLHGACQFDSFLSVKFLVENGADVNIQNLYGNTPLDFCRFSKYPNEIIVFSVEECNTDIYLKNKRGDSVYDFALKLRYEWLVELIEKNAVDLKPAKRN